MLDTVQDLGRFGYRSQGINPGGAADRAAVRILNTLVGNYEGAPVIECHFPGPEIEFLSGLTVAVGGADFAASVDGKELPNWTVTQIRAGSILSFRKRVSGARAYIAVAGGGIACDEWLGSSSTNLFAKAGGFRGRKLAAGDELQTNAADGEAIEHAAGPGIVPRYEPNVELRIIEGPEHHLLTAYSENEFFTSEFIVGRDSSRMGLRLAGPALDTMTDKEMVSCPVTPGVIQLPSGGDPVILLADCQTTGGYPRIATVVSADLPLAAQLSPGDTVRFRSVSMSEAAGLKRRFERDLSFLRMGIRFRSLRT